ncbi:hypothetical protein [Streptomyces sp. NPDC001787]|uniref:hypothetical protein n=1 Tax=Streptomyces sp. NPDC001787 TaxID=3154523 RepID=UPI00332431DF
MRVHKLTFAALAVAVSLSLTACNDGDAKGQGSPSPASSASAKGDGAGTGGLKQDGAKESAARNPGGQGASARSMAGLQPGDALSAHNFRLVMDGAPAEYLQEVSGVAEQEMTLVRGATRSAAVDRWIEDAVADREGRLKDVTVEVLDYQDNAVKQYLLKGAFVSRVSSAGTSESQSLTVKFFYMDIK